MPIKLDNKLPALDVLRSENVFIMDENRASSQDIRPMEVLILNLMPTKEVTETQLLRLLANTPLQINVEFLYMASHKSKNTHAEHMETFYKTFDEIKHKYYDGLIVTGAPVEQMPFEEVDYWQELTQVFLKSMSIQPFICVGELKQVSIISMESTRSHCQRNYLVSINKRLTCLKTSL